MSKNPSKPKLKRLGLIKKLTVAAGLVLILFLIRTSTMFVAALLNLKENPCTYVPLLSDWGVIPSCSPTQTCVSDNYCTWTLDVVDSKCNFSAINHYESRCGDQELSKYTKFLGTETAQKAGWKKEVDVCYDFSSAIINYKAEYWHEGVDYCPDKISNVEAYCKKTDFDTYSQGMGRCLVRFKN